MKPGSKIRWTRLLSLATHVSANSVIFATGNLFLARSMGPANRGEYTKLTLFGFVIALCSEMGASGAATHFSAAGTISRLSILKQVVRRQLLFACLIGIPALLILNSQKYFSVRDIVILFLNLILLSTTTGPSHVVQGLDLNNWKRLQLIQAFFYIPIFIFCYISKSLPSTLFFLLSASYIIPNTVALLIIIRSERQNSTLSTMSPVEFRNYSRTNWLWTMASQLSAKTDLLIISFYISSSELGKISTTYAWIQVSSPIVLSIGYGAFPTLSRYKDRKSFSKLYALDAMRKAILLEISLATISFLSLPLFFNLVIGKAFRLGWLESAMISFIAASKILALVVADIGRGLGRQKLIVFVEGSFVFTSIIITSIGHSSVKQILLVLTLINVVFMYLRGAKLVIRKG